jgi:DNA processing protein
MKQSRTMMKGTIDTIHSKAYGFPEILAEIPDPPHQLYVRSQTWPQVLARPLVAVIGSRRVTPYGKAVTISLVTDLARAGVGIVSGLAYGVDSIAHQAALDAGGVTIAVLAGGLDHIYPERHTALAENIVNKGGALLSEYPAGTPALRPYFVARNRLVSGLSHAVLITEAAEKSGTLHTAQFALEQGRDVLAVPGNITSPNSGGTNNLLKIGATPVTSVADVLRTLGLEAVDKPQPTGSTPEEQAILNLIASGVHDGGSLLARSGLGVPQFNQALTMLEIAGSVQGQGNNTWTIS